MLTILKEIFTWWNHQTFGTRLTVLFFGKLGNKKILHFVSVQYEFFVISPYINLYLPIYKKLNLLFFLYISISGKMRL